jgi:hypothetical protein
VEFRENGLRCNAPLLFFTISLGPTEKEIYVYSEKTCHCR